MRHVAAVLADTEDAEDDVTAARDAILEGSAEAEVLSERCLTHELGLVGDAGDRRPSGADRPGLNR